LSDHTEEELKYLKEILDIAFYLAIPVAQERDRVAREALDAGDDAFARLYRGVPQLFIRPGLKREYDPSVPIGSPRVPKVDNETGNSSDRSGNEEQSVVESIPLDSSTKDDE
jgi:hypothetical protein